MVKGFTVIAKSTFSNSSRGEERVFTRQDSQKQAVKEARKRFREVFGHDDSYEITDIKVSA